MNKTEYMTILTYKLRRLPKEDYDRAIEYFEEYFAEAGPENEEAAIEDLGNPEEAAKELIMNLAVKNVAEPPKTVKRGLSAVWIGILGICAAPIALPVAFALIAVLIAFLVTILAFIFSIVVGAVCVAASGIVAVIGGFVILFHSFADGIATLGTGIFSLGAGALLVYGAFVFCRWILKHFSKSFGKITKGGRRHENN